MGYIYGLHLVDDHRIRYVGMTIKNPEERLRQHIRAAARTPSLPVYRWITKHSPEQISVTVLEEVADNLQLPEKEVEWITRLQTNKVGGDGLNCTKGGEFGSVWDHLSEEQKQRARDHCRKIQQKQTATPEARKSRSELSRKLIEEVNSRPDIREQKAERMSKLWADPVWREKQRIKQSDRMSKLQQDPEFIVRRDARVAAQWQNPEHVARISASAKKQWEDEDYKDSMRRAASSSMKKRLSTPEGREQHRINSWKGTHNKHHIPKNMYNPKCPFCSKDI